MAERTPGIYARLREEFESYKILKDGSGGDSGPKFSSMEADQFWLIIDEQRDPVPMVTPEISAELKRRLTAAEESDEETVEEVGPKRRGRGRLATGTVSSLKRNDKWIEDGDSVKKDQFDVPAKSIKEWLKVYAGIDIDGQPCLEYPQDI